MFEKERYVVQSLELHLFFARIMKEHSIFLEAGFTPRDAEFAKFADQFKLHFESILLKAVQVSSGVVSDEILRSGEIITNFTFDAEKQTENLTAIAINKKITLMEAELYGSRNPKVSKELVDYVHELNCYAKDLVEGIIEFKERILNNVLTCNMFTVNYPLLIEHIIREAKLYLSFIIALENGQDIEDTDFQEMELFWDQIMMEHALFIRGLLDPTEGDLINTANDFAGDYLRLIEMAKTATDNTVTSVTKKTLEETMKYRDFKKAGAQELTECDIRSIIVPLLADHVLREANHFVRILENNVDI